MSHGTQIQNRRSLRLRPPIGQPVAPVRPLRLGAFPRRRTLLRLVPMHFGGLPQIGQLAQTIAGTSADCSALHSCHIRAHPQDVDLGVSCATRSRTKKRLAASFGKRTMILSLCRNHSARLQCYDDRSSMSITYFGFRWLRLFCFNNQAFEPRNQQR